MFETNSIRVAIALHKGCFKSEIACAYCPNITSTAALRKFNAWIQRVPHLMDQLHANGYRKKQRMFTPRQLELIFDALGEP